MNQSPIQVKHNNWVSDILNTNDCELYCSESFDTPTISPFEPRPPSPNTSVLPFESSRLTRRQTEIYLYSHTRDNIMSNNNNSENTILTSINPKSNNINSGDEFD